MSTPDNAPPVDLTTAAIDAINIILTELNISPLQILLGLFSGRPKFEDTENVIAAYNQSAYWPLHALAADMQIWVKNGAPISDSNPAVQATFGVAKQGTVTSIQSFAGVQQGPSGPGYWTIFQLIELSWKASGDGEQAVLQYVKALDAITQVLSEQKPPPTPPPGQPPPGRPPRQVPPPGPTQPPPTPLTSCESGDPNADEILDLCNAVNGSLAAILAALKGAPAGGGDGTTDACCTAVVAALAQVAQQLTIIASALTFGGKGGGGGGSGIDLSGIQAALGELVTAVQAYPPALQACCTAITNQLGGIADAVKNATGTDVSGIVKALDAANAMADVPQAIIDAVANTGLVNAQDAQLAGGGPWAWINTLLHDEWRKLNHPPSPEEVAALKADPVFGPGATAALTGKPMPAFKELLKTTPSVIGEMLLKLFQIVMEGTFDAGKLVMQPPIKEMLAIHQDAIAKMVNVKPGDEVETASTLLVEAMTFGMAAHWAAYAAELVDPGKHVGLNSSAAMLAEFAGFQELMKGIIGVEVRQAISLPHTYKVNAQARAMVPAMGAALGLMARRKIPVATAEQLLAYAGLSPDYVTAMEAGAYRPLQPRTLVQAFLDQPIDQNALQGYLQDASLSPTNVHVLADAITYKSISNVRNSYLSALIAGYGKGVVGDEELQEALTDFNFSPKAQQYVKAHVLILRREALAQETKTTVTNLVASGGMTPDQGLQALEAAGIQPWAAQLDITLATTRADVLKLKKELALEAKTLLLEQRNATRAAVAEFQRGAINEAGLTAALVAIGLDQVLIASVVAVQDATRSGRMKYLYGQLLSPADARVLTERVAAIEAQIKKQLITIDQGLAQLKQLRVDDADANAIVAKVAASLAAASTRDVLLSPITGLPP